MTCGAPLNPQFLPAGSIAFWAEEGELLFSHLRRGRAHTCRNVLWFLRETFKRVPAQAALALRADSGFYSKEVVQWCEAHHVRFTISPYAEP